MCYIMIDCYVITAYSPGKLEQALSWRHNVIRFESSGISIYYARMGLESKETHGTGIQLMLDLK